MEKGVKELWLVECGGEKNGSEGPKNGLVLDDRPLIKNPTAQGISKKHEKKRKKNCEKGKDVTPSLRGEGGESGAGDCKSLLTKKAEKITGLKAWGDQGGKKKINCHEKNGNYLISL